MRLVFHSLLCPMGSGGQLGLYSEYLAKQETGRGGERGGGERKRSWKESKRGEGRVGKGNGRLKKKKRAKGETKTQLTQNI